MIGPGWLDPLHERRTTLVQRLTMGRAALEAHKEGRKIADMAAEVGCTGTWIRKLTQLARLPEEIQAEIRRPRSLAAALSDLQLREVAMRRKPAIARALFEELLGQVRAFVQHKVTPARPKPQKQFRRGLRPVFEQARAWAGLLATGEARSARELAKMLQISNVTVCTYLDLLKLAPQLLAALDQPRPLPVPVPVKHLQSIARLPVGEQVAAFEARWPWSTASATPTPTRRSATATGTATTTATTIAHPGAEARGWHSHEHEHPHRPDLHHRHAH